MRNSNQESNVTQIQQTVSMTASVEWKNATLHYCILSPQEALLAPLIADQLFSDDLIDTVNNGTH